MRLGTGFRAAALPWLHPGCLSAQPHCPLAPRFFDKTKTGDITSRLAVDTTTVSDQVRRPPPGCCCCCCTPGPAPGLTGPTPATPSANGYGAQRHQPATPATQRPPPPARLQVSLNLNVMMRSATQAAVVLSFMFAAQWRLTTVTFIAVPLVLAISKVRPGPACAGRPCEPRLAAPCSSLCSCPAHPRALRDHRPLPP